MGKKDAGSVIDRLHLIYDVDTDSGLCEVAGINRQTLGNWRSRGKIPYTECVMAAEKHGASLDWLLTGEGPMYRHDRPADEAGSLSPREQAILALFRELEETEQREICSAAEEKKRLRSLEQRIEELAATLESLTRSA